MRKLLLTCCLTAFCACNAMAQDAYDLLFDNSTTDNPTMVDSMLIKDFQLDNPVINTIMSRRSIRSYIDKPVEHEKLAAIVKCGINAPSGSNRQPWQIRVVENQELLAQVNEVFKKEFARQILSVDWSRYLLSRRYRAFHPDQSQDRVLPRSTMYPY